MPLTPGAVSVDELGAATGSGLVKALYDSLVDEYDAAPAQTPGNVPGAQRSLAQMATAIGLPIAERVNEDVDGGGEGGATGATGATGAQGPQGVAGPVGATGLQGPQGVAGPVGATGLQGPQGVAGPVGPTGPAGAAGYSESFSAAPTWTVNHNFGRHPYSWAVETLGGVEIDVAVQHVTINQSLVTFDSQTAGIARFT